MESLLLHYLQAHADGICAGDDPIRAVRTENKLFDRAARDDRQAQSMRRLCDKVETIPSLPAKIQPVAGRGYRSTARPA
jgi:hypothetical protein